MKKMKKYKLKEEFKNSIITIKDPSIGSLVFDTNTVNETEYHYYFNNGFELVFNTTIKYLGLDETR